MNKFDKICYPAVFHPEETGYSVVVPDFKKVNYGCFTEGETFAEACDMAMDAIGICLEDLSARGIEVPEPSRPEDLPREDKDFIVPISFSVAKYYQNDKSKSVKKTLTIPEWLNDLAEKENINFSNTLKKALAAQLGISI